MFGDVEFWWEVLEVGVVVGMVIFEFMGVFVEVI